MAGRGPSGGPRGRAGCGDGLMAGPRRFDHDEAYARWQAGESKTEIAKSCRVTPQAIAALIERRDPVLHERQKTYSREWQRTRYRKPCERGCGHLAWHQSDRKGVCSRCRGLEAATTVRDDALRCCECHEWKPDTAFPARSASTARRARHSVCRGCQAAARQRTRERHKTPCLNCGTPRLGDPRNRDSGLCLRCFRAAIKKAA